MVFVLMGLIDFILNLAGLLVWLNWRSERFDPLGKRTPATLIGTLRRAEPQRWRRCHLLAMLGGLLLLRALFYWKIGSAANWAGKLDLGVIVLSFPSNLSGPILSLLRILLYSIFSFGLTLGVFYLWLLLLSILAGPEPVHRLVRMQLGVIDRWPCGLKFLLPLVATGLLWWLTSWPLAWLAIVPHPVSAAHRIEEALVIGLGSYPAWKYVAGALLALHLLNSFIFFGKHPMWNYVNVAAQTLLRPVRAVLLALGRAWSSLLPRTSPLRVENMNFSPALKIAPTLLLDVVGIVLVFLLAALVEWGLDACYARLPL
jgi:hypothetical protein